MRQQRLSLLGIPVELRLIIFEYVFSEQHAIVTGRSFARSWAIQKCHIEPAELLSGLPSLLLVNHQCYNEAAKPFFRNCAFHFLDFMRLEDILHSAGPSNARFLRSISLQIGYATNLQEIQAAFPELRKLTIEASTLYDDRGPYIFNETTLARHILGERLKSDFVKSMREWHGGQLRWEEMMAIQLHLNPTGLDVCFLWDYMIPSRSLRDVAVSDNPTKKCWCCTNWPSQQVILYPEREWRLFLRFQIGCRELSGWSLKLIEPDPSLVEAPKSNGDKRRSLSDGPTHLWDTRRLSALELDEAAAYQHYLSNFF